MWLQLFSCKQTVKGIPLVDRLAHVDKLHGGQRLPIYQGLVLMNLKNSWKFYVRLQGLTIWCASFPSLLATCMRRSWYHVWIKTAVIKARTSTELKIDFTLQLNLLHGSSIYLLRLCTALNTCQHQIMVAQTAYLSLICFILRCCNSILINGKRLACFCFFSSNILTRTAVAYSSYWCFYYLWKV